MKTSREIAEKFSSICISAYEYLQMYKTMREYQINDKNGIWGKIGIILHHNWVLQIAKLHDRKEQYGHDTFSLEYFVDYVNKPNFTNSCNKFSEDNARDSDHQTLHFKVPGTR